MMAARKAVAPRRLREDADDAEREYVVKVSVRFGFLCARVPGVPGAHWDADDGPGLCRQLAAARVPRRKAPPLVSGLREAGIARSGSRSPPA